MNGYQGQIRSRDQENGKFLANQQIFTLIQDESVAEIRYISRIGISAPFKTRIKLNNIQIQIGKTNIYQLEKVEITSIKFVEDTSNNVIIDFIIQL